jgi:hypothetical protein
MKARRSFPSTSCVSTRTRTDDHLETVIRVRLHDKIRALEMLAKHFAFLKEHGACMSAGVILDEYMVARLTDDQLSQLHQAATLLRTIRSATTPGHPR